MQGNSLVVFRRRDRRPIWKIVGDFLYPKGGWTRAFHYVKHRVRRLPDTPERIARGIFVGVFTTFTPFYGLHFFIAAFLARLMNGNILASLLATFFGNPLTYLPIGYISLKTGYILLGMGKKESEEVSRSLPGKFADASADLWRNFKAYFTDEDADWSRWAIFYDEVFFPYLIGGIIPGLVFGIGAYYLSVPLIRAYQKRRRGILQAKLAALKEKAARKGDARRKAD